MELSLTFIFSLLLALFGITQAAAAKSPCESSSALSKLLACPTAKGFCSKFLDQPPKFTQTKTVTSEKAATTTVIDGTSTVFTKLVTVTYTTTSSYFSYTATTTKPLYFECSGSGRKKRSEPQNLAARAANATPSCGFAPKNKDASKSLSRACSCVNAPKTTVSVPNTATNTVHTIITTSMPTHTLEVAYADTTLSTSTETVGACTTHVPDSFRLRVHTPGSPFDGLWVAVDFGWQDENGNSDFNPNIFVNDSSQASNFALQSDGLLYSLDYGQNAQQLYFAGSNTFQTVFFPMPGAPLYGLGDSRHDLYCDPPVNGNPIQCHGVLGNAYYGCDGPYHTQQGWSIGVPDEPYYRGPPAEPYYEGPGGMQYCRPIDLYVEFR